MTDDPVRLVIPSPDPDDLPESGEKVTFLAIEPEGATPGRETPGFFILRIAGEWVMPETPPKSGEPEMPRQFLSLDAVHAFLFDRYGKAPPLTVWRRLAIQQNAPKDFPAIWRGTRGTGKKRVPVETRYIGSFRYWDGRRVDPNKVGTKNEFN